MQTHISFQVGINGRLHNAFAILLIAGLVHY